MSAITDLSNIQLRVLTDTTAQTKGAILTHEELDENIILLIRAAEYLNSQDSISNFDAWDVDTTYEPAPPTTYVSYDNNIYSLISVVSSLGEQPDLYPGVWELVSAGALAHAQNTDYKIIDKTKYTNIVLGSIANLDANYNYFQINFTLNKTLETFNLNHNYFFVIENIADGTLTLTNTDNIVLPNNKPISLAKNELCLFKKFGTTYHLLYTSKADNGIITNSTVIDEITNEANWDENGDFVGSDADLYNNDYYIDGKTKYEVLNSNIIRYQFNNFNL